MTESAPMIIIPAGRKTSVPLEYAPLEVLNGEGAWPIV
jgi:hypothetical protein